MREFIELVKEGFRLAANLGQLAIDVVQAYFRQVRKWSIRFLIAALAPLVVIIPCMMFRLPFGWLYGTYVVFVVVLVAAQLLLLTPMFLVWRRAEAIFPTEARHLGEWLDFIKSVVFNGLSLGIFVSLFPVWQSPGTFPLLILVLACWITLPACAVSDFCKRIYPAVRAIQLLVLFFLLVLHIAFPRQVEQLGWITKSMIGGALSSPVKQNEITDQWASMKWFNNAGEPLVWYSLSDTIGYQLWSAPGFDPNSGKELIPVKDETLKVQIVASLSSNESALHAKQELEKLNRPQSDISKNEQTKSARGPISPNISVLSSGSQSTASALRVQELDSLVNPLPPSDQVRIAVVFKSESRDPSGIERLVYSSLKSQDRRIVSDLFQQPAFDAKGFLDEIESGNTSTLIQTRAVGMVGYFLVGRLSRECTKSASVDSELLKCTLNGSTKLFDRSGRLLDSETFEGTAPGFSESAALKDAAEKAGVALWKEVRKSLQ